MTPRSTPEPRSAPNWALIWISITLCMLAIGVATVYVVPPAEAATEVLDVETVVAARPPSTVPPITTDEPADDPMGDGETDALDDIGAIDGSANADDSFTATVRRDEGATRRSADFSQLIGETTSAIPEPAGNRPSPVSIEIDSIDVSPYPIRSVGLEDDGQLEVPDETEIGWYRYGATAGRPGATVLAAHVSWNQTTGPFFELGTMEPGDEITVTLDDGTSRQYEVVERTMYDKDALPRERIWRTTGDEELVLITCGGDFNPEIRRFRQNIVVYAVPVG